MYNICTHVRAHHARYTHVYTHLQRASVRRLVTCTCQNQYLTSLGYDNAAVCRGPCMCMCVCMCAYNIERCRISRNLRVALATDGVNNAKLFPFRPRTPVALRRIYWTFLNTVRNIVDAQRYLVVVTEQGAIAK